MSLQVTLKAISNPVRRDILTLLKSGRLSAGEISGIKANIIALIPALHCVKRMDVPKHVLSGWPALARRCVLVELSGF